jgi:hypothetical protein
MVGMDWIGLGQDRDSWQLLLNAVMNLRVPENAGNFLTSYQLVSFSRRTLLHGVSKVLEVGGSISNVGTYLPASHLSRLL